MATTHFDTNRPDIADARERAVINSNQRRVNSEANRVPPGTNPLSRDAAWKGQLNQRGLAGMGTSAGVFANGERMQPVAPKPAAGGFMGLGSGAPQPAAAAAKPSTPATVTGTPTPVPSVSSVAGTGKPMITPFGTVSSTTAPAATATPTPQRPSALFDTQDPRRVALMQAHPEIWKAGSPENLAYVAHANQFGEQHAHDNLNTVLGGRNEVNTDPDEPLNKPANPALANSPSPPSTAADKPSGWGAEGALLSPGASGVGAVGQWAGNKLGGAANWAGNKIASAVPGAAGAVTKGAAKVAPYLSAFGGN